MTQDEIIEMARQAGFMQHLEGYYCVVCGRFLPADEHGVIVHDDIEHPLEMTFDDEERPQ